MTENWGPWRDITRHLQDTRRCPDCGTVLEGATCHRCGLDLRADLAREVRRLSFETADLLERRIQTIAAMRADQAAAQARQQAAQPRPGTAVPGHPVPGQAIPGQATPGESAHAAPGDPSGVPAPAAPRPAPTAPARPSPPAAARPGSGPSATVRRPVTPPRPTRPAPRTPRPTRQPRGGNVSMQPILAGAGALLLAVAAVVFVFFTFGDNLTLRAVVTGIVTVTAAAVAALLRRGGLRTTSEAIAALAAVLCWVDVELAMQAGLLGGLDPALARAVVLAGLAPMFVVVGHRLRVRTWVSAGFAAALLTPVSAAVGLPATGWTPWWWTAACVVVAVLAWALARLAPVLGARLDRRLRAERAVLRVVEAAGLPLALILTFSTVEVPPLSAFGATTILWSAIVTVALAGGLLLRVRSWAATGVLTVPVIPVLTTIALPATEHTVWRWTLAMVLVGLVAHTAIAALPRIAERLGDRLGTPFDTELTTLRVLRGVGLPLALLVACFAPGVSAWNAWEVTAALWLVVTVTGIGLGWLLRVRSWASTARLAAPLIALLVVAGQPLTSWSVWWWGLAFVVAAFVAHGAVRAEPLLVRRLGDRTGVPYTVESVALRAVRAVAPPVALVLALLAVDAGVFSAAGARVTLWSAVTTLVLVGGALLRVRSWSSAGLVAVVAVPVLLVPVWAWTPWSVGVWTLAFVVVASVAWAAHRAAPVFGRRLGVDPGTAFRAERVFLRIVRGAGFPVALGYALVGSLFVRDTPLNVPGTGHLAWPTLLWIGVLLVAAGAGHALRVRSWMSTAVVVVPLLPLLTVAALDASYHDGSWLPTTAILAGALATLLVRVATDVSGARLSSRLVPERRVNDVVAVLAVLLAGITAFDVAQPSWLPGMGGTAVLLLVSAVVVAVLRRCTHHTHWLVIGGVLVVLAGCMFGLTGDNSAAGWITVGAACAWTVLAVLTTPRLLAALRLGSVRGALAGRARDGLLLSGWITLAVAAVPATVLVVGRVLDVVSAGAAAPRTDWFAPEGAVVGVVLAPRGATDPDGTLAAWAALGALAFALATVVAARLAPGDGTTRIERQWAPFAVLSATIGLALHPRLLAVISLVALAVLGWVLIASVTDRASAWAGLRPVVDAVRTTALALGRVTDRARLLGGRGLSDAERRLAHRAALLGALVVPVLLAGFSWVSRPTAIVGALVVSAMILALRGALPRPTHAPLVGIAYVYALTVLGVALAWLDLSLVATICTVSAVASLVTIVVTLSDRVTRPEWYTVLGVTAAPFVAGVVTVVFERTWWSAVAAAVMLGLELVLLLTTRVGLPAIVRGGAAFLLLPTSSVMITSAGAMILETSGSPYVLPTAATFVAAVAAGAARVSERISGRVPDADPRLARTIRGMLERSAALTGAITIGLAYARPAAGPDIAVAVLLLLTAGSVLLAREPDRRWARWLSAALALAALWTALGSRGVSLVEAYTFPPAVIAVILGLSFAWRAVRSTSDDGRGVRHAIALAGVGGVLAVAPTFLVYLTRVEPGDWRAYALVGTGLAASVAAAVLAGTRRLRSPRVRLWLVGLAAFASLAGTIESWRLAPSPGAWPNDRGVRGPERLLESVPASTVGRVQEPFVGIPVATGQAFVAGLIWAAATVVVLVTAVFLVRGLLGPRGTRLLRRHGFVPASTLGTVSVLAHMEPAWGAVITLLVLELALLTVLVLGVRRVAAGRAMGVAPWFLWTCAALIAIAAWSPRELRVETFSAPLGVGLVLAGWFAMRAWVRRQRAASDDVSPTTGRTATGLTPDGTATGGTAGEVDGETATGGTTGRGPGDGAPNGGPPVRLWPVGYAGSWRTMAPGVLALVGPSVLSTATDPLTVRACGVVLVALAAVLAGSRLRLSAMFWLGVITLGIEVTVVFAKLGVGVSPLPWILTLVPAALVLLIIATLDERRTAASGGTAAYLRDLR